MKKKVLFFTLIYSMFLIGCGPNSSDLSSSASSFSSSSSESSSISTHDVTINFYLDFNRVSKPEDLYFTCITKNGTKISEVPPNPINPLDVDFPIFKGWSTKEVIDDYDDLWDFDYDVVNTKGTLLKFYGIWISELD